MDQRRPQIPPPPMEERRAPDFNGSGPEGRPGPGPRIDLISLFIFVMVVALGLSIAATVRWRESEKRAALAEAAKTAAELSFLKAQVNPHFLFNTLNNIYTLALTHNEHTAESIMRLSNIMRYVTDGGNDEWVPLQKEAECILDYVALHKLRLGKAASIELSIAENFEGFMVPPLIFMSFIENAFKYGISKKYPSPIVIMLQTTPGQIMFYCNNVVHPRSAKEPSGGIGLTNTKKRLEALYKNKYFLDIKQQDRSYTIVLTIDQ